MTENTEYKEITRKKSKIVLLYFLKQYVINIL